MPDHEEKKVKVRVLERYTHYVHIPKEWVRELGLLLAGEVVLEKWGANPLNWEIKIKPVNQLKERK